MNWYWNYEIATGNLTIILDTRATTKLDFLVLNLSIKVLNNTQSFNINYKNIETKNIIITTFKN